jgi:hypothetical protein
MLPDLVDQLRGPGLGVLRSHRLKLGAVLLLNRIELVLPHEAAHMVRAAGNLRGGAARDRL